MSIDLAWAAGFFDGEGTFQIVKDDRSGGKYYARMRIGNTHKGSIEKFTEIMGLGNIVREDSPAKNANFKQYRWSTSGQNAVNCAKGLHPYLVVKKHECEILLRWEPLIANGRNIFLDEINIATRHQLYLDMKDARARYLTRIGDKK